MSQECNIKDVHLPETKEQLLITKTVNIGSNNIYKLIYVVRSRFLYS